MEYSKLVIDLEFNPLHKAKGYNPQLCPIHYEIIEIAAVILDENNDISERFRCYVKPQLNGVIEPEITKLTGITYADVENSLTFEGALDSFIEWIGDRKVKTYSWSMSDENQLFDEADFKGCYDKVQSHFRRWIDLQRIYSRLMGYSRQANLKSALNILQIDFKGSEHSALADAENTSKILAHFCDKDKMAELKSRSRVTFNSKDIGGIKLSDMIKIKTRKS